MTQCELILKYINDFGSITTFEGYSELGITRTPSRMFDLRKMGYQFKETWITKKNRYGKTVSFKKWELIGGMK